MQTHEKRILVAEDDRILRRALEVSLRKLGHMVLAAVDGEEALRMVRSQPPDLILLDLMMPKVSGLEVLRALKSEEGTRSIPILVLSNSSKERDIQEVCRLGVEGYQVKANLSLDELGDQVKRLLGGAP